jgi:hypothetical protein
MLRRILSILALLLLVSLVVTYTAYSSDVTGADFYGIITVSNNSTATGSVSTNISGMNTPGLISAAYLNSTANNCAIQNSSGVDIAFMPGYSTNPWCLFVNSIGTNASDTATIYIGNVTGGKIRYFPDVAGMTVYDDDTLEFLDEFQFIITDCFIDTTAGASKYIIYKSGACNLAVSATTTGTITFTIPQMSLSVSATSIPSGEYDIEVTANVTHLKLYINSVLKDTILMNEGYIPQNDSGWTFFSGGSTLYVGSLELNK